MQDYRRDENARAIALGCVGFILLTGIGLAGLMLSAAVALLR